MTVSWLAPPFVWSNNSVYGAVGVEVCAVDVSDPHAPTTNSSACVVAAVAVEVHAAVVPLLDAVLSSGDAVRSPVTWTAAICRAVSAVLNVAVIVDTPEVNAFVTSAEPMNVFEFARAVDETSVAQVLPAESENVHVRPIAPEQAADTMILLPAATDAVTVTWIVNELALPEAAPIEVGVPIAITEC